MKDYIAIIRKLDFIDLFKFGHLKIDFAVPFDGNVLAHSDDDLFDMLTSRLNMYDYSFEYLIIHFKADECKKTYVLVDIRDVSALYTFDEEAKKEMTISFDPRIQLYVSPWSEKFSKLHLSLFIEQSQKGIQNLWEIFNLPKEDFVRCSKIITPPIVQEVFREFYSNERPSGEQSIWVYLLRYERHSLYPKGVVGYFCDMIHIYCNYLQKGELIGETAENTNLFLQLMASNETKFEPLLKIVETSPLYKQTTELTGYRFAVVVPLFLLLKEKFLEGVKADNDFINHAKKIGGFECSIAMYLLGLSLGYDKTYDAFYETIKLPIFKKCIEKNLPKDIPSNKSSVSSQFPDSDIKLVNQAKNNKKTEQVYLFPECNDNFDDKVPIKWMRKGKDVRPAYDEEEMSELDRSGYKPVVIFNDNVKKAIAALNFDPEFEKNRFATTKLSKNKK